MPNKDPRKSAPASNTASEVQTEVMAVVRQLGDEVSADAYEIGVQAVEYVNQQAFSAFLKGYNEGAARANNPFSSLRRQLSASRPKPINLLLAGSTSTAPPKPCLPSE